MNRPEAAAAVRVPGRRELGRTGSALVLAAALAAPRPASAIASAAAALSADLDEGTIRFDGLRLSAAESLWRLQGSAEVHLSAAMRDGLVNGVPLEFVLEIALAEPRDWWFDRPLVSLLRRSTLVFYDLTGHYRLQTEPVSYRVNRRWGAPPPLDTPDVAVRRARRGQRRNFRSLWQALAALGDLRGLPLASADGPEPARSTRLVGTIRLRLDDGALPIPLQPLFGTAWRLSSGERRWMPQRPTEAD